MPLAAFDSYASTVNALRKNVSAVKQCDECPQVEQCSYLDRCKPLDHAKGADSSCRSPCRCDILDMQESVDSTQDAIMPMVSILQRVEDSYRGFADGREAGEHALCLECISDLVLRLKDNGAQDDFRNHQGFELILKLSYETHADSCDVAESHEIQSFAEISASLDRIILAAVKDHESNLQIAAKVLRRLLVNEGGLENFASRAPQSLAVAKLLRVDLLHEKQMPSHFRFDLTATGFAYLEFPRLKEELFPADGSLTFTLIVWLRIDRFDANNDIVVLGAYDHAESLLLFHVERTTNRAVLQTSKGILRFRSFTFEADKWYHVAVVHQKSRQSSEDQAELYVDGKLSESRLVAKGAEQQQESNRSRASGVTSAFIGVPNSLRQQQHRQEEPHFVAQWAVASMLFLSSAADQHVVKVHYALGLGYHGNMQHAPPGSFMTYRSATTFNCDIEQLPLAARKTALAMLEDESGIIDEAKILLSIAPLQAFQHARTPPAHARTPPAHARSLHDAAVETDAALSQAGAETFISNMADTSRTRAGSDARMNVRLTGGSSIVNEFSMAECVWRSGITAYSVNLVNAATSRTQLLGNLELCFGLIGTCWRNSEAIESENGYEALAALLPSKIEALERASEPAISDTNQHLYSSSLRHDLLASILDFVGYDAEHLEASIIINPLAYKILVITLDIWDDSSAQCLFFKALHAFASSPKFGAFNNKKLYQLRIIKRLIETLKGCKIYRDATHWLVKVVELLTINSSGQGMCALARYIVFDLDRSHSTLRDTASAQSADQHPHDTTLAPTEVPEHVLSAYVSAICVDNEQCSKFARNVSAKVREPSSCCYFAHNFSGFWLLQHLIDLSLYPQWD
ncbi:hypothetical protein MRB53_037611 [Persea americana]|nr:hypothetical protein MRB53_037611 [Persea americana]